MIKIKLSESKVNGSLSLKVEGHAGQAPEGHDIICASASILIYTVAQMVTDINSKGGLKKPPTIKLEKGDAVVTCHPKEETYAELLHTYFVAQVGYHLLAQHYPQYLELIMFSKNKGE